MAFATEVNAGADKWKKLNAYYGKKTGGDSAVIAINYLIDNVFAKGKNTAYGNARLSLITNYGQYCSYCGMPVYDSSLAVEHILPKASFPDVMMCYPNFLLACPVCNSIKGEQPDYSQAVAWWNYVKQPNPPKPTYQQIKDAGLYAYILADNAAGDINKYAFKAFEPGLKQYGKPFNPVSLANATYLGNSWVNINDNKVAALVWDGTKLVPMYVYTEFASGNPSPPEPYTQERANRSIALTGLNRTDEDDPKMTDRRNTNRTVAFFEAVMAFSRLQQVFALGVPLDVFNALANQVLNTARLSGFYEVWIYVLYFLSQQGTITIPNFYTNFKTATCDPANAYAYFAGTDPSRLP
jgi:hypothetical protein